MTTTDQPGPGLDRRSLLKRSAAAGLGIAFAGSIDAIAGTAAHAATRSASGYGPLVTDPRGILSLPEGFSYRILATVGETVMEDGTPTPADMDGMAAFATSAGTTLVYNHEISGREAFPVPDVPGLTYDPGSNGGTTSIDLDRAGNRLREYVSCAGTQNNCAGGVTPWQTWLTCEETEQRKGGVYQQDHGYVFEVSPVQSENPGSSNVPLKFLGRFAHEAVAVDPRTNVIYQTEDAARPNGLYFRWVPPTGFRGGKGALVALAQGPGGDTAGTLQAMRCSRGSRHIADLSEATQPGTQYKVTWVDVPDRDARTVSVRKQLTDEQVTRARKLEGAWWADGGAYFVSSFARLSDGSRNEHDGQVWFYDPEKETVTLTTIFGVNPDPEVDADNYDGPDNITVSPYGGVILAEDGNGVQHLVGVTDQGKSYTLARNDQNDSEFTGPVFSPDGSTLFACIQSGPGRVFAITGPWGRPSNAR
jgi:secreted PhoX family phosphatase